MKDVKYMTATEITEIILAACKAIEDAALFGDVGKVRHEVAKIRKVTA